MMAHLRKRKTEFRKNNLKYNQDLKSEMVIKYSKNSGKLTSDSKHRVASNKAEDSLETYINAKVREIYVK